MAEYNTLGYDVKKATADLNYKLVHCNDPYRLNHLLKNYIRVFELLQDRAEVLVEELENGD